MIEKYGMNLGQMLSIPFILLGVFLVVWALTHPRQHFKFPDRYAEESATRKS